MTVYVQLEKYGTSFIDSGINNNNFKKSIKKVDAYAYVGRKKKQKREEEKGNDKVARGRKTACRYTGTVSVTGKVWCNGWAAGGGPHYTRGYYRVGKNEQVIGNVLIKTYYTSTVISTTKRTQNTHTHQTCKSIRGILL